MNERDEGKGVSHRPEQTYQAEILSRIKYVVLGNKRSYHFGARVTTDDRSFRTSIRLKTEPEPDINAKIVEGASVLITGVEYVVTKKNGRVHRINATRLEFPNP